MAPLWLTIGSLSLGDQEAFDGPATIEVGLNAISTTDLFDTFTKTLCVGLGSCGALVVNPIITSLVDLLSLSPPCPKPI